MNKDKELEIIDLYSNKFMDLKKDIDKEELKVNIGKYIIVRSYVVKGLRDSIHEGIYILKEVLDDCIKVTRELNPESILVIEYERLREYEILNKNEKIITDLKKIDYKNNYLVELTNIYDRKIKVILSHVSGYYEDSIDEACEISFNYKYNITSDDYGYDSTEYAIGLIKEIKILDEYDFEKLLAILNYSADYYETEVEYLTYPTTEEEEKRLSKIIKLINKLDNINYDYIAQFLGCNYNFIKESIELVDDSMVEKNIELNFEDVKYYLNNIFIKNN